MGTAGWLGLLIIAVVLGVVAWLVPMPPVIYKLLIAAAVICGVLGVLFLILSVVGGAGGVSVDSLAMLV
jgi:hypothetical protein